MSYEGGVTPSDVTQEVTPHEVTPVCGQRGSRHMAVVRGDHLRTQGLVKMGN